MNIPRDRELVQESLKKIAEGPTALMAWAKEHADEIDQQFMNQLRKMIEYSERNQQQNLLKTFRFLEQCFSKMFDFDALPMALVITKENFQENFDKASGWLKQEKSAAAIKLLHALALFLVQCPQGNAMSMVEANLGLAYAQQKKFDQALEHLHRAVNSPISNEAREKLLVNLGNVYRETQKFKEAIHAYTEALTIARERKDAEMEFMHLNNLAIAYLDQKDLETCLKFQNEALAIATKLGKAALLQDCITRLAVIHALKGDVQTCQELCQQGLSLFPGMGKD